MEKEASNWLSFIPAGYGWIVEIVIVVFLTLFVSIVLSKIYKKISTRLYKSDKIVGRAFAASLFTPIKAAIWIIGLMFAVQIAAHQVKDVVLFNLIEPIRNFGLVIIIIWFANRFITNVEEHLFKGGKIKQKKIDKTSTRAIANLIRMVIFILGALALLQIVGIPLSGVIAFGGVGGLAVGFAAKDMLANFFGGFMIFFDRPFAIGDWIRSPDRNIEGTVEQIGWRHTRIRTFDKRPLYVPNAIFLTISIENPSRMQNRRIKTNVGIRYKDANKLADIVSDIEDMLRAHPDIDASKTLFVKFINFGPSSLEFLVYTFTKTIDWVTYQSVQQDVFLKMIEIISKHDAECAFPSTTLYFDKTEPLTLKQN